MLNFSIFSKKTTASFLLFFLLFSAIGWAIYETNKRLYNTMQGTNPSQTILGFLLVVECISLIASVAWFIHTVVFAHRQFVKQQLFQALA